MIQATTTGGVTPAVSAVVPCRNERDHIEDCLRSLLEQAEPEGGFEVVVADGLSEDGTRAILQEMASANERLRLVDNPSRTTPCGMNRGIGAARGRWIAILGSHNRYAPDYLIRCLEVAQTTGADNVGGAMYCEGEGWIQRAIAAAHHSPFSAGGALWHDPGYEGPADTVFGGFYRREALERIGLFDEELVRNQDDELNLRLTRAGGRIWQSPRIRSWYRPRNSLTGLFKQYLQYGYWKVRVIQKHRLPASWRHLVPGAFVLSLVGMAALGGGCALVSPLWPPGNAVMGAAFLALVLILGTYVAGVLAASVTTAHRQGWSILPVLPAVFACYHFGYGYGFLRGVLDFVICRKRRPGRQFVQLSRPMQRQNRS